MLLLAYNYLVALFIYAKYFPYQFLFHFSLNHIVSHIYFESSFQPESVKFFNSINLLFSSLESGEVGESWVCARSRGLFGGFDLLLVKIVHPWTWSEDSLTDTAVCRAKVLGQTVLDVVDVGRRRLEPEWLETILRLWDRALRLADHVWHAESLTDEARVMVLPWSRKSFLFL